jgi:choice-of-anchor C domain-containing protein
MERRRVFFQSAVFVAVVWGMAMPANADLVNNGNFAGNTSSPLPVSYTTVSAGDSTTIPGWTVLSGSVDWIGGYWQSPTGSGTGSIDLDGTSPGAIYQTITTVANQTYDLSFFLSGNPDGGSPIKSLTVDINGTPSGSSPYTYITGTNSRGDMQYVMRSFLFTATGTSTTIEFASNDASTSPWGPVLGGVSVTATPEPALYGVLGIGIFSLFFLRRRSRAA